MSDRLGERIEQLWDVLLNEFTDGGPGRVVNRVARAELAECDAVIAFLKAHMPASTPGLETVIVALQKGEHRE